MEANAIYIYTHILLFFVTKCIDQKYFILYMIIFFSFILLCYNIVICISGFCSRECGCVGNCEDMYFTCVLCISYVLFSSCVQTMVVVSQFPNYICVEIVYFFISIIYFFQIMVLEVWQGLEKQNYQYALWLTYCQIFHARKKSDIL